MAMKNPYELDPAEMEQEALLRQLQDQPVNTTMPVTEPPPAAVAAPAVTPPPPALTGHRDQWSANENVARRGDMSRLSGVDPNKYNNDEQTLKYQALGFAAGSDPNLGVGQFFADTDLGRDFKRLFPNARQTGDDKINWGYGDPDLDFIQGLGSGNAKFAWQPQGPTVSAGNQPSAPPAPSALQAPIPTGSTMVEEILKALQNGEANPLEYEALMQQLSL